METKKMNPSYYSDASIGEFRLSRDIKILYYNTFYTLFLLTWVAILWTTFGYKINGDGATFFTFFTNWNWTIQCIFFTLELFAYLSGSKRFRIFVMSFAFWIANGTTWLVFWLVFFMIKDNANYFLELTDLDGGKYTLAMVLEGHALFHTLISVSLLVFIILQKDHVDDSVSLFVDWEQTWKEYQDEEMKEEDIGHVQHLFMNWNVNSFLFLAYNLVVPLLILGIYAAAFNIRTTYGITTPYWQLVLSAIAIVLVFNVAYPAGAMMNLVRPRSMLYRIYAKKFARM